MQCTCLVLFTPVYIREACYVLRGEISSVHLYCVVGGEISSVHLYCVVAGNYVLRAIGSRDTWWQRWDLI